MSFDAGEPTRVGTLLWQPGDALPTQLRVIGESIARWDLLPDVDGSADVAVWFLARGPARRWGGEPAAVRHVGQQLIGAGARQVGVAVAPGRLLSWATSRLARQRASPVVIDDEQAVAARARLPVGVLSAAGSPAGLDASLVQRLMQLGLRSLGDVAALTVGDLVGRFGEVGRQAHRWAIGEEPPVAMSVAVPEISVQFDFDPPATQLDMVVFAARRLADRLDEHMRQRGESPTAVRITLDTEHGEHLERLWSHSEGLRSAALVDRVRWQVQAWQAGPVVLMRFTVIEVGAERGRQAGWWGGEAHGDQRAAGAVARVVGLIGREAATQWRWRGGRDPADRYERVPAAPTAVPASTAPSSVSAQQPWPGGLPAPSPARVFHRPVPVDVRDESGRPVQVSGRGELSAPPARIVLNTASVGVVSESREVVAWAGPWPLEEQWWRPVDHRRRARLQVVTDDGVALLVHLEQQRWWLRAQYS